MSVCDKSCIANIDGFCAAEQCEGPITITRHPDPKTAAKFYRLAADLFRDYFGEES